MYRPDSVRSLPTIAWACSMLHVPPWASTSSNSHSIQYGSVSTNVPSMSHRTPPGRRRARSDRLVEDMRHRGYSQKSAIQPPCGVPGCTRVVGQHSTAENRWSGEGAERNGVDGQGGPATFEDGFVDRSWRDAVTSTEVCARDGICRQAKAAIDQRGARDGPPFPAESILDLDLAATNRAQQTSPLDRHPALRQSYVGGREITRARQLVPGNVILRDQNGSIAQLFGQSNRDRSADRIEYRDRGRGKRHAGFALGRFVD